MKTSLGGHTDDKEDKPNHDSSGSLDSNSSNSKKDEQSDVEARQGREPEKKREGGKGAERGKSSHQKEQPKEMEKQEESNKQEDPEDKKEENQGIPVEKLMQWWDRKPKLQQYINKLEASHRELVILKTQQELNQLEKQELEWGQKLEVLKKNFK